VAEETQARRRGRPPAGAREAILTAAWDLISEAGLATLTTREVARRAGVSEASVFYHFGDKAGLLEQVVLTGLAPLKAPAPGPGGESLVGTLGRLATALEAFFDHAMPVLAAIQSDASLRRSFARRLVDGDLGPHRGVQMLSQQLAVLSADGLADPGVDPGAASLLLIGACFLRSWERQMTGAERALTLPALPDVVHTLARLLAPGQG
jgi:AcrR family transcriptional regulator